MSMYRTIKGDRVPSVGLGTVDLDGEQGISVIRAAIDLGNDVAASLGNGTGVAIVKPADAAACLERLAHVPIHFADPLVRRAPSLQQTADAAPPTARMSAQTLASVGVAAGARVRVRQPSATIRCPLELCTQRRNLEAAPVARPRLTSQRLRVPRYCPDLALRRLHGTPW